MPSAVPFDLSPGRAALGVSVGPVLGHFRMSTNPTTQLRPPGLGHEKSHSLIRLRWSPPPSQVSGWPGTDSFATRALPTVFQSLAGRLCVRYYYHTHSTDKAMGLAVLSLCRMRHTDDIFSRSNDTPDTALGTRQDCKEHGHGPAHRAFVWWTLSKQLGVGDSGRRGHLPRTVVAG